MKDTCLKTSPPDDWIEQAIQRGELRLVCGGQLIHPGYLADLTVSPEPAAVPLPQIPSVRPFRWLVAGTFLAAVIATVMLHHSAKPLAPVQYAKPRMVLEVLPSPAPTEAVLSTAEADARFEKIGAVLEYLVSQRQEQNVAPQAAEELEELPLATVIVDKAYLRVGPGRQHSPVMAVSRGTRLLIEQQDGEWYRVIGPTGTHLFASTAVFHNK